MGALILNWLKARALKFMFKKLKAKLAKTKFLKGKLTYSGLAIAVAPLLSAVLGADIAPGQIELVIQAFGLLTTWLGYLRRRAITDPE